MHAVVFDIDHTLFDANNVLHDGVAELLHVLNTLGLQLAAVSSNDHRALVRLDEAGIGRFFGGATCSDNSEAPKSTQALHAVLQRLGVAPHEATLVSHAHADIKLGKDAGLAKTIGVSHGMTNIGRLRLAGADHVIPHIPAVLDVLG